MKYRDHRTINDQNGASVSSNRPDAFKADDFRSAPVNSRSDNMLPAETMKVKTVGLVSLSSGLMGEKFVCHEVQIGLRRLQEYGMNVKFLPNAMKGIDYLKDHPEARAEDLLQALRDPEIDLIFCAIGGDDTYRLLPYLFDNGELEEAARGSRKIFLGFSDTTINHLMFHKIGIPTFYGQSFLTDTCELEEEMLPYTKQYFEELIATGRIREIEPSAIWYLSRPDFGEERIGTKLISRPDRGFELLQGPPVFSGEILGGCLDSLYDLFDGSRYKDMPVLAKKYGLFPSLEEWKGKILLLETSEEQMHPEKYERCLGILKETGIFSVISGILVGKPMDEIYEQDYKKLLQKIVYDPKLPIVCNINIGHGIPRCIIPFGVNATVDAVRQKIVFHYDK